MLYNGDAPGDWGTMQTIPGTQISTETLAMSDGCQLFMRSWQGDNQGTLLLMHGLGGHGGWYVDMGNKLASQGLSIYAVDHRGFGRSEGIPGHIEQFHTYVEDLATVCREIHKRTDGVNTRFFILGHSMGGIFATHLAVKHAELMDGLLFLNPWIQDSSQFPLSATLRILGGGMMHSKRRWRSPGGVNIMTTNQEAMSMLEADSYWQRDPTATFLMQITLMRLQVLKLAGQLTLPTLVMQAGQDRSVIAAASRKFYETLAAHDKTWQLYPDYDHDTELAIDRTQLDHDIVEWIQAHLYAQSQ